MKLTVGGDKFIADPRRSCGPILLCLRIGNPFPGVPPGDEAHEGAIFILVYTHKKSKYKQAIYLLRKR